MPTFVLLTQWSVWGEEKTFREIGKPFDAESPGKALERLQAEHSFLKGFPWAFAGKSYKLATLVETRVGEEFKMQDASAYGD